jgi:hypothetical protein
LAQRGGGGGGGGRGNGAADGAVMRPAKIAKKDRKPREPSPYNVFIREAGRSTVSTITQCINLWTISVDIDRYRQTFTLL